MAYTLDAATQDVLDRLSDSEEKLWTRDEIKLYVQDGYDEFCRRTKALFDVHVIENLPPTGNWQTDFEKYLALQKSGWGLTDEPFHMTDESERNFGVGGAVGGSYAPSPAGISNPPQRSFSSTVDGSAGGVPTQVPGGTLPETTLQVIRVTYDQRDLVGLGSQQARLLDPNYLTRSGDPQFFLYDKDGINYLRLIPNATGGADYDDVVGSFGTLKYRCDEADATVTGTSTLPTAAKVVVVDGVTYTFVATVATAGDVKISTTTELTLANLVNCINKSGGTEGAGYDYMAPLIEGTAAAHPRVEASLSALVITLTQRDDLAPGLLGGVAGEAYTLTTDEATFTLSAATFDSDPYDTVVTTEVTGVTTGGYGILRHRTGVFPAGGPWGTPTRIHPDTDNIKVEVIRLGRNFTTHPCELPSSYQKYITYWAMAQALHRDGPGQSDELAAHFRERFEMGVMRLSRHVNMMSPERVGKFGQAAKPDPFGLGMPQAPYPYGEVRNV